MGVGVLLVEQNARQALAIADRGYLLENGRIVGEGSSEGLRDDPAVRRAYLGGGGNGGGNGRERAIAGTRPLSNGHGPHGHMPARGPERALGNGRVTHRQDTARHDLQGTAGTAGRARRRCNRTGRRPPPRRRPTKHPQGARR